jgi:hypothetical protein
MMAHHKARFSLAARAGPSNPEPTRARSPRLVAMIWMNADCLSLILSFAYSSYLLTLVLVLPRLGSEAVASNFLSHRLILVSGLFARGCVVRYRIFFCFASTMP